MEVIQPRIGINPLPSLMLINTISAGRVPWSRVEGGYLNLVAERVLREVELFVRRALSKTSTTLPTAS